MSFFDVTNQIFQGVVYLYAAIGFSACCWVAFFGGWK
jgi:hypothetical protein